MASLQTCSLITSTVCWSLTVLCTLQGVAAARTMVDDYMASLQTRSLAAAADRQVPPASPPKPMPTGAL